MMVADLREERQEHSPDGRDRIPHLRSVSLLLQRIGVAVHARIAVGVAVILHRVDGNITGTKLATFQGTVL